MDEGLPIAYTVLEQGVPVLASGGEQVGTVFYVVAAPEEDIFHGIVIAPTTGKDVRFVEAADVASLHERGVDLKIDVAAARNLPAPAHGAPVYTEDPAGPSHKWGHLVDRLTGHKDWHREH